MPSIIDGSASASFNTVLPVAQGGTGTATGISSAVNSALGMRNRIMNGKMDIAQRGTTFAAITDGAHAMDRFRQYNNSNAVLTVTQNADVPSSNEFQFSYRVAVTTADTSITAGKYNFIRQIIEGYNVRDLIGQPITISFWVRSTKTGTHCVVLNNSGSDRAYVSEYTISSANTWEKKSITISAGLITAGTWNWTNGSGLLVAFVLACGSTYFTTANAWQTGNLVCTSGQVNCLDSTSNIFAITGVQLEKGSVATEFEHRFYGMELAMCQRYYEIGGSGGTGAGFVVQQTGPLYAPYAYKVTKRATPTNTYQIQGGSGATFTAGNTNGFYQETFNSGPSNFSYTSSADL